MDFGIAETGIARGSPPGTTTEVLRFGIPFAEIPGRFKKQVGQLVGRITTNEGKLPGQPKGPESAKAIQTHSGKETEDLERSVGARKPKPSVEAEEFYKEEVTEIITEEPEFEMPEEDTKIPQLKPRYFRGKLDNHFEKFVEVVCSLSINMPLLDALQVPTYSRYFKYILANKYEIATLYPSG
jgi:hypothetical protein